MQGIVTDIANIMRGTTESGGSQLALHIILSQMTQHLKDGIDGMSTVAQCVMQCI